MRFEFKTAFWKSRGILYNQCENIIFLMNLGWLYTKKSIAWTRLVQSSIRKDDFYQKCSLCISISSIFLNLGLKNLFLYIVYAAFVLKKYFNV